MEGFIILDLKGNILDVNEAFSRMHGYSREELLSMKVYDLSPVTITPEDYAEFTKGHIEMGGANFETRHRRKDGRVIDVLVSSKYLDVGGIFFSFHRDITEQKREQKKEHKYLERTKEALKISDERLSAVVDSISEVIIILDEDGRYIDILSGSEELLYRERGEIIGLLVQDVLPKDVADAGLEAIRKSLKTNKTQTIEYKLDVPAGERWFEGRISPIKSIGDKKLVVMVARDITEHKQLDDQIRESENRYRTLIELGTKIGEAVIMLQDVDGIEGVHAYVSDQWPRITGYTREELLNMTFFDLVSHQYREASIKRHRQRMKGKTIPNLFEMSIIRKGGGEVPIELTSAVTIHQGNLTNVVYLRDITERKKMEAALKESENLYRTIFEATGTATNIIDEDGTIVMVNNKWEKTLGFSREQTLGRHYTEFLAPESLNIVNKYFKARMTKPDIVPDCYEIKSFNKWGNIRDVLLTVAMVHGTKMRITSAIDITQLKQYQEHLEELVEERTAELEEQIKRRIEFTRALVHELKTPLSPLMVASDYLASELKQEPLLSFSKNIYRGAHNLSKRIDELLDLAKAEVGTLKLKCEAVNLLPLFEEVVEYMAPEAQFNKQSLTLDLPAKLPILYGDKDRLRQVLLNLLGNALKFTNRGGEINLKARENDFCIVVEVADNGCGIDQEDQKYLFKPYRHLEKEGGTLGGLGLGLPLSKTFIELHGGQLKVTSQKDEGSTFSFWLPLKPIAWEK